MKFKLSFPVWFRDVFFHLVCFFLSYSLETNGTNCVNLILNLFMHIFQFNVWMRSNYKVQSTLFFPLIKWIIDIWFFNDFFSFSFQIKSNPENASIITILVWVKSDESVLNRRAAAWARERAVWWHAMKHIRPSILWQKPTFSTVRRQHKCERTQKKCCSI